MENIKKTKVIYTKPPLNPEKSLKQQTSKKPDKIAKNTIHIIRICKNNFYPTSIPFIPFITHMIPFTQNKL